MVHYIKAPLDNEIIRQLKAGDMVYLSGTIYTARDAAHKRLIELINSGKDLPFNIEGAIVYYVGPTPAKPDRVIGSAGPTTSYRMDAYAPRLLDLGLKGIIGKGDRSESVTDSIKKNNCVYFAAIGGAGAYLANCIKSSKIIAYEDLGAEAIYELEVENFPVIVAIDSEGRNYYKIGRNEYLNS